MTEHVCEWEFAETQQHEGPTGIFGCIVAVASCKHCGLEMGPTQMETRLNENETLKADKRLLMHVVHGRAMASSLPKHLKEGKDEY